MITVLFLVFVAVPFVCSATVGKRVETTIPLGFFAIVAGLYIFAIFDLLALGFWIVLGGVVACYGVGFAVLFKRHSWTAFAHRFFTPLFWVWTLLFVVIWFVDRGKLVHFYDEFTHWGDVVWVMCRFDKLGTLAHARSLFSTYPPAMALLQYMVQKVNFVIGGAYREDLLYMTTHWFMTSLYLPFMSQLSYKRPLKIAFGAGMIFLMPLYVFKSSAYALIYIDSVLSILSGFAVMYAFMCNEKDPICMLTMALALLVLVLMKDVGILFAGAAVVAYVACCNIRNGGIKNRKCLLLITIMVGTTIITWGLWKLHIAISGAQVAQGSFQQPVDLNELLNIMKGSSAYPWRRQVLNKYVNQFFIPIFYFWPSNGMVTHACLIMLTGGGLAWLSNVMNKHSNAWGKCFRWVCCSWGGAVAVYIAGMGILYLFKYNYEEAIVLSAWNRYMDMIVAYGVFVFAAGCMLAMKEKLMSSNAKIAVITLMLAIAPWSGVVDTMSGSEIESSQVSQHGWIVLANEMKTISESDGLGEEASVYLVYADDSQPFLSMRYRLRPMKVNDESWALGQYNADPNQNEEALTVDEMRQTLQAKYDYLILCAGEEDFIKRYGILFENAHEIRPGRIYRIQKDTGLLQLCN